MLDTIEKRLHLPPYFLCELTPVAHDLGWSLICSQELTLYSFITVQNIKFCLGRKPQREL
jgi:hypothetical protein